MRSIILFCVIFFTLAVSAGAQSLRDNPDYLKSLELQEMSRAAFDAGDFAEAQRLAEESKVYAEKSDLWIAEQLARYRANAALLRVRNRFQEVDRVKGKVNFPLEYAKGKTLYEKAYREFRKESWEESRDSANAAFDALSAIVYVATDRETLPASYVVRKLPGNTDCFWNISGYDFIYGDPWAWRLLYDANKDVLPQENNPDLILPGIVLVIPERKGETRSGTWDNGKIR